MMKTTNALLGTPPDYASVDLFGLKSPYSAFHPTEGDYHAVLHFFLHWVPVEVADLILYAAQYWPRVAVRRTDPVSVRAFFAMDPNPDVRYLFSVPVPQARRVEKVRFCTDSCDQGWTADPEPTGSYRWAWSWFEASILRPCPAADLDLELGLGLEVDRPDHRRWLVQRNLRAVSQRQQREVSWTPHSTLTTQTKPRREPADDDELLYTPRFPDENVEFGHGRGDGFVEALQPGDRIVLHARAWRHMWRNDVTAASVEIFYTPI